jgi:hypothetical protein
MSYSVRMLRILRVTLAIASVLTTGGATWAGPVFPWRPRSMGPAPYTQRQAVRPAPVPASRAQPAPTLRPEPTPSGGPRQRVTTRRPDSSSSASGIHIAATERFLDELIRVESQADGPVRDCILGAEVVGSQSTETQIRINLLPDPQTARFDILLRGTMRNLTENRTPQAIIQAEGNHRFDVSKMVQFDGHQLLTRSPSAWLYPCQQNRSAFTPASAIPILGPLASQYALGVAEQRRPEAERITARRITEQVAPQFNSAIDARLASLNRELRDELPQKLAQLGIEKPSVRISTTDQELIASLAWDLSAVAVQTEREYPLAASTADDAQLRIGIRAGVINAWLSKLPLGGQEIAISDLARWQAELQSLLVSSPEPAISQHVSSRSHRVPVRPVSEETDLPGFGEPTLIGPVLPPPRGPAPSEPTLIEESQKVPTFREPEEVLPDPSPDQIIDEKARIVLARENPVSLELRGDEAVITIIAAFKVDPVPQTVDHRIQIPLRSRIEGNALVISPGTITVDTVTPTSGPFSETVRQTIEKQVRQRIQPTRWPIERRFEREQGGPVTLRLKSCRSETGWLSLAWTVQSTEVAK